VWLHAHQHLRLAAAGCRLVKHLRGLGQTFDPDNPEPIK
jgi:hypothetical protein